MPQNESIIYMNTSSDNVRIRQTQKIKAQLQQHIDRLREDLAHVTEPRVQAIFESSAEALAGSVDIAFEEFDNKCAEVWNHALRRPVKKK